MKMKKLLSILLTLVLVFSVVAFSACGGDEDPGTGSGGGNGGGGTGGGYSETEAQGRELIEIGAGEHGFGLVALEKAVAGFNKTNANHFAVIKDRSPNFDTLAEQQIDTDSVENDLLFISEIYWKHNAIKGKFVALDDVLQAPFNDDYTIEEAMDDDARNNCYALGPDGQKHYYTINASASASSIIVNMSVAKYYEGMSGWKKKVKKINQVTTMDQLNDWVKEIERLSAIESNYYPYKDGSGSGPVKGWVYPGQYMQYWDAILQSWWVQYSGIDIFRSFFEFDSPSVFSDKGRLAALQTFYDMDLKAHSLDCASDDHIQSQTKFLSGRAALIPNGTWISYESAGVMKAYGTEIKMIYAPTCDGANYSNVINNSASGLNCIPASRCDGQEVNVAGAKEFLKYYFQMDHGPTWFTSETGSLWGFDGVDGPDSYATALYDDLDAFSQNCIDLINNATAIVTCRPNNFEAPNYLMYTSGTARMWNSGSFSWTKLMDKEITPQTIFDNEVNYAQANFQNWLDKIKF